MNRTQKILLGGGMLLFVLIFAFGRLGPKVSKTAPQQPMATPKQTTLSFEEILQESKQNLPASVLTKVTGLEQKLATAHAKAQKINCYQQLYIYWMDSAKLPLPALYYAGESAKLENSEKSLTFAGLQLVGLLLVEDNAVMQYWIANNATVLLEQSLTLNPRNDSSKIGIAACYLLGGTSANPMAGVTALRQIVEAQPNNVFAHLVLGMGSKKSGQYDKAIAHFLIILHLQPLDLQSSLRQAETFVKQRKQAEATAVFQKMGDRIALLLNIAECYELQGDKPNAIQYYAMVRNQIANEKMKDELSKRITALQQ